MYLEHKAKLNHTNMIHLSPIQSYFYHNLHQKIVNIYSLFSEYCH